MTKETSKKLYTGDPPRNNQSRETTITQDKNVSKSGGNMHSGKANNDYKTVRGSK